MRTITSDELDAVAGGQMSECELAIRTYVNDVFGIGSQGIANDLVRWFC